MTASWLSRIGAFIAARTPRERAGLALVAAAMSLMMMLATFEGASNARESAVEARVRALRAEALRTRDTSPEYREAVRQASVRAQALTLIEPSEGVAQARAVGTVRLLASEAGLANVVAAPLEASAPNAVGVSLSADFSWTALAAVLQALQSSDIAFGVEEIGVSGEGEEGQTMLLKLRAPFQKREART